MKKVLIILIFLTINLGARAQTQDCSVVLNHFYITVDTNTYQAILGSQILNSEFAYSYEKIKNWGGGIYIIGKDNYIEIFHPNSISGENIPTGFTWVCHTSLVANCTEKYKLSDFDRIKYSSDENFDELSVFTQDSVYMSNSHSIFTTREMNKGLYENLTKKTFSDSLPFLSTDYNNLAESDSSNNYLFNNVTGIEVNLNTKDTLSVSQYLNLIGYTLESKEQSSLKFVNSNDFIKLHFSESVEIATICVIHFGLNRSVVSKQILIGNSRIEIEGNTGKWKINKIK